jgi:vacuolar-type H+-ATPase subunit B/Vma2
MQIFGHAGSSETFTFNDLNEIYLKYRDNNELLIVSDEMGKSKPASLFFLSKFGCQLEKVKFYSNTTINSMWDEVDVLLTSNPNLILEKPKDKIVVKYITNYNKNIKSDYEIEKLKDFDEVLQKLKIC